MATKNYSVGPQDGWVKVVTASKFAVLRISAFPHTHPFYVFGDPTAVPTAATQGVLVCHKPFCVENSTTAGNVDAFYVRVVNNNPSSFTADGRTRFDVYADGGTLP